MTDQQHPLTNKRIHKEFKGFSDDYWAENAAEGFMRLAYDLGAKEALTETPVVRPSGEKPARIRGLVAGVTEDEMWYAYDWAEGKGWDSRTYYVLTDTIQLRDLRCSEVHVFETGRRYLTSKSGYLLLEKIHACDAEIIHH